MKTVKLPKSDFLRNRFSLNQVYRFVNLVFFVMMILLRFSRPGDFQ
ncbi:hypothetical protein STRDD13_01262 [Streptococcus sp. DD13]|nr:hypothetical protein STRDD13_01262 [Streptococcus sp. DD13]